MSRPIKSGCVAGIIHLVFVGVIAFFVAFPNSTFGGPECWLYAALLDLPVHLAWGVLFYYPPKFIQAHDFLFALLLFGVGGTLQWFLIAYTVSRHRSPVRARDTNI